MSEEEFIRLIQKHSGIISKILYLYVEDPEEKRDLRQEIQLQAWKAVGNFRGESQFSTWLYRVALNTVLTFKRKRRVPTLPIEDQDAGDVNPEISDKSERLLRAIKGLSDIDKTIITLHLDDYDYTEIAEIMGLQKNHIGVKLHRIKELLKKKLTPYSNG